MALYRFAWLLGRETNPLLGYQSGGYHYNHEPPPLGDVDEIWQALKTQPALFKPAGETMLFGGMR
jgi:hypothetical protein